MRFASLLLAVMLAYASATAQGTTPRHALLLRGDVLQHSVAQPGFTRSFTPLAPGLRVGLVRQGRSSKRTEWRQQGLLGWYTHPQLHDAFMLSGEVAFRLKLGRAFLGLSGGPGYMLQLPYAPTYRYQDGQYVRSARLMHRFTMQLAAEAGCRIGTRYEVHLRLEELFEFPYGLNASPVLPHRFLTLGLTYNLTKH